MSRSSRRVLLLFAVVSAIALIVVIYTHTSVSVVYAVAIGFFGVLSIAYYGGSRRRYVVPALWSMFYVCGYVLSGVAAVLSIGRTDYGQIDIGSYLSDDVCRSVVAVIGCGMAGVFVATWLFESVTKRYKEPQWTHAAGSVAVGPSRARKGLFSGWFICSCSIIGVMWVLGNGRTGLFDSTALPFKLGGVLVYIKNVVIPLFGFIAFVTVLKQRRGVSTSIMVAKVLFIGSLGGLVFLSRGFFVAVVGPCLLYMFCYSSQKWKQSPALWTSMLATAAMLLVLIPSIQYSRDILYSGGSVSPESLLEAPEQQASLGGRAVAVITLATGRILGLAELTNIERHPAFEPTTPWRMFVDDDDTIRHVTHVLFAFNGNTNGVTAFGYGTGMWGMFYLGHSLVIVFLGTLVFTGCVLALEELFLRTNFPETRVAIAFLAGFWLWGGIDWFLLWRLVFTIGCCYAVVRYMFGMAPVQMDRRITRQMRLARVISCIPKFAGSK